MAMTMLDDDLCCWADDHRVDMWTAPPLVNDKWSDESGEDVYLNDIEEAH